MVCSATPILVQTFKKSLWIIRDVLSEPILETWGSIRYWPKIPFLSVLHENKALHDFHEWGQHATAGCIEGLD